MDHRLGPVRSVGPLISRRPLPFGVTFVLFALPGLLWAVATPLSSGPDEPAHVLRAASVATGQVLGEAPADDPEAPTLRVEVPAGVQALPEPACYAGRPEVPATCSVIGQPEDPRRPVPAETAVGRHPPPFYAVAGVPLAAAPGPAGAYLTRTLSALACAAFLAAAHRFLQASARPGWPVLGLLVALTPMALYLTAVVNPNGLEFAAAACLWAAVLTLAGGGRDGTVPRAALTATGIAGVTMTLTRPISALWLALAAGAGLVLMRPERLRTLVRRRATWWWAAAGVVVGGGSMAWLAVVGNPLLASTIPVTQPLTFRSAVYASLLRSPIYAEHMVGVLGWLDVSLPPVAPLIWGGVLVLLLVAAVLARRWWALVVLAALIGATVAIPPLVEAARYNELGFIWQGRYTLPLAAGVPILAGVIAGSRRSRMPAAFDRLVLPLAALLGLVQILGFAVALRRYTVGTLGPLTVSGPGWNPPLPAEALLVMFALSQVALVTALAWFGVAGEPAVVTSTQGPPDAAPTRKPRA